MIGAFVILSCGNICALNCILFSKAYQNNNPQYHERNVKILRPLVVGMLHDDVVVAVDTRRAAAALVVALFESNNRAVCGCNDCLTALPDHVNFTRLNVMGKVSCYGDCRAVCIRKAVLKGRIRCHGRGQRPCRPSPGHDQGQAHTLS